MARTRGRIKGRRDSGTFWRIPNRVSDHEAYISLSAYAKAFLPEFVRQYKGKNNGDLSATLKLLKPRGWNSNSMITKCVNELIAHGLIIKTRQGGKNICSLYAIAWESINECGGKLEIAETRTAPNCFLNFKSESLYREEVQVEPPRGSMKLGNVVQLNHHEVQ